MKLQGKRIFMTGGAGFIGATLCRRLAPKNKITIYDNFHRDALRFSDLAGHPNVTVVEGDILDTKSLQKAAVGQQVIIHLAAIAGVSTVVNNPAATLKINMIGTYNVLEAIRIEDVERFVHFSTSEVYGPFVFRGAEDAMTTQGAVGEPRWVYGISKVAGEHLAYAYFKEMGLPSVSIRPFNVYGPQQVGEGAAHHFVVNALKGRPLIVHNDGAQIRSWCYIDDLIEAVLASLDKKAAVGHVFNIGNPQATCTTLSLAQQAIRLTGSKSEIIFKRIQHPDVEVRVPGIDKAKKLLGYEPKVGLDEGLRRTIAWYRQFNH